MENRETGYQPEEKDEAEEFFKNLWIFRVTKEEFLRKVKARFPNLDEAYILQAAGINFDQTTGFDQDIKSTVVLIRTDIVPQEYIPYVETHEKWSAYIARKKGYNLDEKSARKYKQDKQIDKFDDKSQGDYYEQLSVYNYAYVHEYAIYKEYEQAMRDGKLDTYHKWISDLHNVNKKTTNPTNLAMLEKDTQIRESIYRKLTEGTKHYFSKQ